jgi:NADPH2:quinone reductase
MLAAYYSRNGSAREVLGIGDLPPPAAGPGEVLVRISASGVNPIDLKWRSGLKPVPENARRIPHFDGAGQIVAVGEGVSRARIGERVWVHEALWQGDSGTAARFCAVPSGQAIALADHVDFTAGACLGIPALTAHRCVFADGPVAGQRILVTGGAGAVGNAAIQIARLGGAEVIATVSGDRKAEAALQAGAGLVVNYKTENAVEKILSQGGKVDRIIEVALGENFRQSIELIKDNGVIAAYASDRMPEPTLPFRTLLYKNVSVRHVLVFGMPRAAKQHAISDLGNWLQAQSFHPLIGGTFPLEQIAEAHEQAERGQLIGQAVVTIPD